jgi:glycosyltransferase involved in cell wall biosynthesis
MQLFDLCVDARMAHSGGIGTCIRHLAPLLNHPPFRVILLVNQVGESWCKGIEQIAFSIPIYSLQEQLLFPFKIPRCDLFWSPHYNVPLFPIRAKKRAVTIHDLCHLTPYCSASQLQKAIARQILQQAINRSQCVITGSQFSKKELNSTFQNTTNIKVIPHGVDQTHYLPQKRPLPGLPKRFVLFVGTGKPHKNREGLIRAFSEAALPELHLVLIGKPYIKQDRILTLLEVSNDLLPAFYSTAELLVFPSFYEGFGLPPLEAMSCGCPTIVSRIASLPEICGDASFYINPESSEELTEALIMLISNQKKREALISKGFERAKLFSWNSAAALYGDLFEKTIREL